MEQKHVSKAKIAITLSVEELAFLCNAINETLEVVEDWEFQTRTGESKTRAREMLAALTKSLDAMK